MTGIASSARSQTCSVRIVFSIPSLASTPSKGKASCYIRRACCVSGLTATVIHISTHECMGSGWGWGDGVNGAKVHSGYPYYLGVVDQPVVMLSVWHTSLT